jgi:hypothetical protein
MTTPKTAKKPRRRKLRAVQMQFYNNRIIKEGEVFVFVGDKLPAEHIAVAADSAEALGVPAPEPVDPLADKPPWTTDGFVTRANRDAGRDEEEGEEE